MPPQMMPMIGPPPTKKNTWEEFVEQLDMQISNAEISLKLLKAQLKEAQSHVKKKEN